VAVAYAELGDPQKLPTAIAEYDFDKDVRALMELSCVHCHNAEKDKGGLQLQTRELLLKGGDEYKAVVEGKSGDSAMVHFAARLVEELEMPPKGKGDALTPEQIGKLRGWIDAGAPWPEGVILQPKQKIEVAKHDKIPPTQDPLKLKHWAFQKPVKPVVADMGAQIAELKKSDPTREAEFSKLESWAKNEIDHFVLAKLLKENLVPSPETNLNTLCRRLYLDLVGLPPKPEEVEAFLQSADKDRNEAVKELTDRLLATPQYGERWARQWLDAARYADSDGYEKDKPRFAHFYRDWVIQAYNRDLPYNEFVIEQLAGDQLPNPTQDQIVATGFLRNSLLNEEGGVDPEQFRMEAMFDRMDCLGKAVLGLTIQCAQCHDHKYDPITQEEYFKIFAFLNNDNEAQPIVYTNEEQMKRGDLFRQIGELEMGIKHTAADWEQRMNVWEDGVTALKEEEWKPLVLDYDMDSATGEKFLLQKDGSYLAQGYQPPRRGLIIFSKLPAMTVGAVRIEFLNDANLPANGPGRSLVGTFAITSFTSELRLPGKENEPFKFTSAVADINPAPDTPLRAQFNESGKRMIGPPAYTLDGKDETAWSNDIGPMRRNRECEIVFVAEKPVETPADTQIVLKVGMLHGGPHNDALDGNSMGRFRISVASKANPELSQIPRPVRTVLAIPRDQRSEAQQRVVFNYWRTQVPEYKEQNDKIEALWKEFPEGTTQMVLASREGGRTTRLFKRGDWLKPDYEVAAGTPKVLHPLPKDAELNRLTLARWLVDDNSSTAARAAVNRVWQSYFGTGLLISSEDFGTQSETPSHPELLDWLAVDFMENGWSMKHLHRLITSSATYQQSSRVSQEMQVKDPYNRLIARGARFRVEAETIRDSQLAASGLLNLTMGGRSLMPPAPAYLFKKPISYSDFNWVDETGENRYRRAVYTYRRRTTAYPFLQAFDAPDANSSCVRRIRSNTPLQALTTLNELISMEASQALARRMLESGVKTDAERIAVGFSRVLGRKPSESETKELLALLERQTARIRDGLLDSWILATGKGEKPQSLPEGTTPTQLAGYTVLARVMLNLDEAMSKE